MRLSIFIFFLTFVFSAFAQQPTVSLDNFIIRNAAGSVSKPINMDSVTAYDARNLGNQSAIGTANDTILTTLNGAVRKVKAGTIISNNQTFIANSTADTLLGVNGNVQTKLNAYQNNSTGEREIIPANGTSNFIYDPIAYNSNNNSDTGAIVLEYPIGWDSHMQSAEIDGFNYNQSANNAFKIRLGFFNYTGQFFVNVGGSVTGQFNRQVRLGYVNNHICIIIGDSTDVWQYPKINLSKAILSYSSPVQMINGWTSRITRTFVGYTAVVAVPLNTSFTSNADSANIALKSVSDPINYYTKLTNQYNTTEPTILQNGLNGKILGAKTINGTQSTYLNNNYDLNFSTGTLDPTASSVKMVVKQNGLIGIGTVAPSELVSLAGTTGGTFGISLNPSGWSNVKHRYIVPTTGSQSMLSYNWNGSVRDNTAQGSSYQTFSENYITFGNQNSSGNPTEVMRIIGGNVGIGTTTPSYLLDVIGDARFNGIVVGRGNSGSNTNTVVGGGGSGSVITTGTYNTFLGLSSGLSNTVGQQNTFLGVNTGYQCISGTNNSFIGVNAGFNNYSGTNNTFLGVTAGLNSNGNNNVFLGYQAGYSNSTASNNSFIGVTAGYSNTTGGGNSFLGYQAGYSNTTGSNNSFLGYQAGYSNTTGSSNSFIGYQSGYYNTTGYNNSFLGYAAGQSNTTGYSNSFLGYAAGYSNTTGVQNSFLGTQAGYGNTTGNNNTFSGSQAGNSNTTGYGNSFLSSQAGYNNTTGSNNSYIGYFAGVNNKIGNNNLYLGYNSGYYNISGSSNTYLGVQSTSVTNEASRSNMLVLGTQSNGVYIFGDSTGAIGIGTTTPAYKLDVNGNGRFAGNVGIGTAPTSNALEVAGNLNVVNGILSMSGGQYLTYGTGTINGFIGTGTLLTGGSTSDFAIRATNNMAFGIGTSQKMTLSSNGYLGLGTITPAYVLDVNATTNPIRLTGLQAGALTDDILSSSSGVIRKLSIAQIANPIKAYVIARNSNTSFTSGSSTQIAYTTVVKDSTSSFSANTFTAPRSGIYSVAGVFALVNGGGITTVIDVTAGGTCEFGTSNQILGSSSNYNNTLGACNFSANVFMNAGETIFIKATQTTGITQTAAAATRTYLTIKEL